MNDYDIIINDAGTKVLLKDNLVATLVEVIKPKIYDVVNSTNLLVFDFINVEMIDSIGIGFLVATYNTMNKKDGTIEVINLSSEIFDLFNTMNLQKHFKLAGV